MEGKLTKKKNNVIIRVEKGSIAEELGIMPGDVLLSVNETEVVDVFDYRFLMQDEYVEVGILGADGECYIYEVDKEFDEDFGIIFESGLMDEAKSCQNKCIFCFIDQMPPGMRETLYFKDDDSRLSFLQGNYVTLTNMKDADIDRIIRYHLSPINISVHTTDLELRKKMLQNKRADQVLSVMERLAENHIEMNLQVVLCRGINDGEILSNTIRDLSKFIPFARSLSVVPIGLTKYRDGLYKMEPFDRESARAVLRLVSMWQEKLKKETGTAFVFASDEFYLKAEEDVPPFEAYEDFLQYENGVGMLASMKREFLTVLSEAKPDNTVKKTVSIATGRAAYALISSLTKSMTEKFPGITILVYCIENEFFGSEITVAGLLTGQDLIRQLQGRDLGEYLILPDSLLKNGEDILLDDYSVSDLEKALHVPVVIALNSGESLFLKIRNTEDGK